MKCAVSEQVHNHFRKYEVEYLQFAFRWMNNLLMRELPLRCTIRLWDTYQVCTALPAWLVTVTCVPVGTGGAEGNKAVWPQGVYSQLGGSVGHLCLRGCSPAELQEFTQSFAVHSQSQKDSPISTCTSALPS